FPWHEREKSSSRCERTLGNVSAQGAWLQILSRSYLHFAFAPGLAAPDDFAHACDANRLSWPDFLPAETRWPWRKTFFYLEVPNNEAERRDAISRTLLPRIDAGRLPDDEEIGRASCRERA